MQADLINIKNVENFGQGTLAYFEGMKDCPFQIKRIYYTYSVPVGEKRGMHAHKKLKQLIWCPCGEVEVILDDGKEKISYILNSPEKGLLILKGYWRDIYFKREGSVLCVAASDYYNEEDYIRDYDDFLNYVKEGYWDDENKL